MNQLVRTQGTEETYPFKVRQLSVFETRSRSLEFLEFRPRIFSKKLEWHSRELSQHSALLFADPS